MAKLSNVTLLTPTRRSTTIENRTFQRQQWLLERATVLRYTYIAVSLKLILAAPPYLSQ